MSGSKKRRAPSDKAKASSGRRQGARLAPVLCGAAAGAGTAVAAALMCALIFAAISLRSGDPVKLAPLFGALSLAISSAAAGAVFERVTKAAPLLCAALGAGITAAALIVSLIPALPEVPLVLPKLICAAIPVACSTLGGYLAAPRTGRRRRRRR